ncbi:MAG: response regulator transcription factor, partial [Methylacidiphilales bacterium]|nr:response regulator transcription factor [Candidatus Methylacidiphilales bacterium]
MAKKILIADPDKSAGTALGEHLKRAGFAPIVVNLSERVCDVAKTELPSLIILEAIFNEPTGFEICKKLQADYETAHLPIIMLSEQADDIDRILGLEMGAEDYLCKPCHPRELLLKVRKITARYRMSSGCEGHIQLEDLILNKERCEAYLKGERLSLTAIEFKLLYTMAERIGRVQTRERLLKDVWGYDAEINSRTLDTHIRKIRTKLGDHESLIETAYGFGYRIIEKREVT